MPSTSSVKKIVLWPQFPLDLNFPFMDDLVAELTATPVMEGKR